MSETSEDQSMFERLKELADNGLYPAEILDYYVVVDCDVKPKDWAEYRKSPQEDRDHVQAESIRRSVREAKTKLNE